MNITATVNGVTRTDSTQGVKTAVKLHLEIADSEAGEWLYRHVGEEITLEVAGWQATDSH